MPDSLVQLRECDLACSGVDAIHACKTHAIQISIDGGAVRQFDLVLLIRNWFALLIEQLDFDPGLLVLRNNLAPFSSGRTCRLR